MKEWDEYSATANYVEPTTSASTSSTLYSSVSSSSYSNYRSYCGYSRGWKGIGDCWDNSNYLYG